ncbi:MAG: DUF4315 family protein [Clostridia bacterium]|nr:DUF4315 family protein [Clostridia bacterium]
MRSIQSINTEIAKTEGEMSKIQEKYDALAEKLLELQKQKREYETRQIMDAYMKSGKSMQEIMTFLGA